MYLAQVVRRITVQEAVAAGSAESFGQYVSEQEVQKLDGGKCSVLPGVGFRFEVLESQDPVVVVQDVAFLDDTAIQISRQVHERGFSCTGGANVYDPLGFVQLRSVGDLCIAQGGEKLLAEKSLQYLIREEVLSRIGNPLFSSGVDAAGGQDDVDMGMKVELSGVGVEYCCQADLLCAEMLRISRHIVDGVFRRIEQCIVDGSLVIVCDGS